MRQLTAQKVRSGWSIASFERCRHVCFTPNYGRITAAQRTDALGQQQTCANCTNRKAALAATLAILHLLISVRVAAARTFRFLRPVADVAGVSSLACTALRLAVHRSSDASSAETSTVELVTALGCRGTRSSRPGGICSSHPFAHRPLS